MPLVSAPSINGRFTQLVIAAAFLVGVIYLFAPSFFFERHIDVPSFSSLKPSTNVPIANTGTDREKYPSPRPDHPIDHLIRAATEELDGLLAKETKTLSGAAQAYRERRGRQPPPGFDAWFEFAQNNSAILVEDFWDQIYDDLNPFWGVPPQQIREQANVYKFRLSVREHAAAQHGDGEKRIWLDLWQELVQTIAEYLPDVDMPINEMDESRMVVPWEDIDGYIAKADQRKRVIPEEELKDIYQSLASLDKTPPEKFNPEFSGQGPYWKLAVVGCPPNSIARGEYLETDYSLPPPLTGDFPQGSYKGYVKNWTLAKSPCDNPHLQGLHGTFIEPLSLSTTEKLFPLFGGSKLPMNNEILLPAAMYWSEDPFYSGGEDHGEAWRKKHDKMIWRGAASGGRNKQSNWSRFQRHRFVSMVNATSVRLVEEDPATPPPNFVLPAHETYQISAMSPETPGSMGDWIQPWSDVAFVHLLCFPATPPPNKKKCDYTDPYFAIQPSMPMSEQYDYKYLPDIDGNSFSGRYRGFLGSTSLPIKATIYQEWHDNRLIPWKHFVPMDNTFIDIYGIMDYFIGNPEAGVEGHDDVARELAVGGKKWAEKVLRKEDMQIYVFRLLLEYARLCDDDRERMGWREGNMNVNDAGVT